MEELVRELEKRNQEWGEPQYLTSGLETGETILMIDGETQRPFSPQMHEFYEIVSAWEAGFWGATSFNPVDLVKLYTEPDIKRAINLVSEYYHPLPPSREEDWERTAIFAKEDDGNGLILFWWHEVNGVEPALVSVFGGDIKIFADLDELLRYAVSGEFSERGDAIYASLEKQRGTLSD